MNEKKKAWTVADVLGVALFLAIIAPLAFGVIMAVLQAIQGPPPGGYTNDWSDQPETSAHYQ